MNKSNEQLLHFISGSPSSYHAVLQGTAMLEKAGFERLDQTAPWELKPGGSYYTVPYGSTLFAFTIGEQFDHDPFIRAAAAHTDHPGFHIKPLAEVHEKNYLKVNTESYGGLILNTWLDRPLSIAGKAALKSSNVLKPKVRYVDFQKPVLTIPNLAIHINRDINKGVELNKQTDTLPLLAMMNDTLNKDHYFLNYLAEQLDTEPEEILDFDLYVYNAEEGCMLGMNDDFISCPRLDNLTSVIALLDAVMTGRRDGGINLIALYDNEEIGSRSKQGADSFLTNIILEKIFSALGKTRTQLYEAVLGSLLLSVDVAHGLHPNYPAKNDLTNFASLNGGVVLKIDSNQKYAFDTEAIAAVQQLCEAGQIKYQKFVNRSDAGSGSTLGSIASAWLPMKTVDLGVPLLAMHSARELMGSQDQEQLCRLIRSFFEWIDVNHTVK